NGGTTFNSEEYCDSKTESSARLDHDIEEKSILEMDQICWTCLNTKNVNYMKDTCIGDANSLQLYEEIANIKIGSDSNESMQMMMICTNCSIKLGKVNSFIKMAQFHYTIMEEAANQIQKLNAQCDFNWVDYNVKKTAILRNALSNKKILDDTNILKIERDNGDQKGNKNEQDENVDCMSSIYYRSESSDDDIPLSEKLKILVNPTPETLKFNIKSRKRTRRKLVHSTESDCILCKTQFASHFSALYHIIVKHGRLKCCRLCLIGFKSAAELHAHYKSEEHNTKCAVCGEQCYESFATEEEFKRHVEEMGHELFVCDKCPSQFVREENFKLHLKNHDAPGWNKNMFATWGKSAQLRNEKGEFVCCHCPKVFKDKQRLDNHIRVHTNERPYVCHICAKGFKTWIHRKTHLNIHLGIKKWTCKYCSKSFTNSSTLKGHEMIHTGERPHNCPECKKGFITISAMKKHRMTHFKTSDEKKNISLEKSDLKRDSEQESIAYKYDHIFAESNVSYEMVAPIKDTTVRILTVVKDC
ncbi:hypothetical protein D910_09854, partial [Dendroctonus ponderosae]